MEPTNYYSRDDKLEQILWLAVLIFSFCSHCQGRSKEGQGHSKEPRNDPASVQSEATNLDLNKSDYSDLNKSDYSDLNISEDWRLKLA